MDRFAWPVESLQAFFRGERRQPAVRTTSSVTFTYRPKTRPINRQLLAERDRLEVAREEEASAEEVRARGGFVLGIRFEGDEKVEGLFSEEIVLPRVSSLLAPFLHLISGQLLAYFLAVALKRDVDRPRALAKSVTVA